MQRRKAKTPRHIKVLKAMEACDDAIEFAARFKSLQAAYAACDVTNWILWLSAEMTRLGLIHHELNYKVHKAASQWTRGLNFIPVNTRLRRISRVLPKLPPIQAFEKALAARARAR